jgi:hypothetical protein
MPRTERNDGYTGKNCKLDKDFSIEYLSFYRIMGGNGA